jgi:hypothetical protein
MKNILKKQNEYKERKDSILESIISSLEVKGIDKSNVINYLHRC